MQQDRNILIGKRQILSIKNGCYLLIGILASLSNDVNRCWLAFVSILDKLFIQFVPKNRWTHVFTSVIIQKRCVNYF